MPSKFSRLEKLEKTFDKYGIGVFLSSFGASILLLADALHGWSMVTATVLNELAEFVPGVYYHGSVPDAIYLLYFLGFILVITGIWQWREGSREVKGSLRRFQNPLQKFTNVRPVARRYLNRNTNSDRIRSVTVIIRNLSAIACAVLRKVK